MNKLVTKAAVIEAAVAYTQQIVRAPYLGSLFAALLIQPDVFKFSEYGGETAYRAITGANAVNYDPETGWNNNINTGSSSWVKVKDTIDRAFAFNVDFMTEVNSILAGMPLSGVEIMNSSWMKYGQEADMLTVSRLFADTKDINKHLNTDPNYGVSKEKIVNTLFNIENDQLAVGIPATTPRITAITSEVYNALRAYLVENGALYNYNVLQPTDYTVRPVPKSIDPENALGVNMKVYRFNNHIITVLPKHLMQAKVTLLDGVSEGQKDGGVAPDTTSSGSGQIDLISVPLPAAAVSIRHLVSMLTVPLKALSINGNVSLNLDESMKTFADGLSTIENIGVDQFGDQFGYKNRIRFDAVTMEHYKDSIVAVHGALV